MRNITGNWVEIAKKLPIGRSVRTQCSEGCGSDLSQMVGHNDKGYSRYCFRCNDGAFESRGIRTITAIDLAKQAKVMQDLVHLKLPNDYTLHVPTRAALWYYKFGISAELASSYGIGYTDTLGRVVLPVYEDGDLVSIQMRAIDNWKKPKYLNVGGLQMSKTIFESGVTKGITVITEDILSAIKVGRVHHATSILGTNMTDYKALKIAAKNHTALIWLDGDIAGVKGAKKAKRQLELLDVTVRNICTPNDPKTYSLDEIRRILND